MIKSEYDKLTVKSANNCASHKCSCGNIIFIERYYLYGHDAIDGGRYDGFCPTCKIIYVYNDSEIDEELVKAERLRRINDKSKIPKKLWQT